MNNRYDDVNKDIKKIQEDLSRAVADAKAGLQTGTREAVERAHQKIDEISHRAEAMGRNVNEYAREHTWAAVGVAALVGLVVGMLFSRRKD